MPLGLSTNEAALTRGLANLLHTIPLNIVFAPRSPPKHTAKSAAMGLKFSDLYAVPHVNPASHKARAIPLLNPINIYGRVFFFSWFGFMVAFWAWYTFPPLVNS